MSNSPFSKEFLEVILLPILCHISDDVTIVRTSVQDELNLSIDITVGSSIVSGTSLLHRNPPDDFF